MAGGTSLIAVGTVPDGSAWVVGDQIILNYQNGQWEKDQQGMALLGEHTLSSLSVNPDGSAWAVGDGVSMQLLLKGSLSVAAVSSGNASKLFSLADSVNFKFSQPVYGFELSLSPEGDTTTNYLNEFIDAVRKKQDNKDSSITITFSKNARRALEPLTGKIAVFGLKVKVHPSLSIWQRLNSNTF